MLAPGQLSGRVATQQSQRVLTPWSMTALVLTTLIFATCDHVVRVRSVETAEAAEDSVEELMVRMEEIRRSCGAVCDTSPESGSSRRRGPFYDRISKPVDCRAVWAVPEGVRLGHEGGPPPRNIPEPLVPLFERYDGAKVPIDTSMYFVGTSADPASSAVPEAVSDLWRRESLERDVKIYREQGRIIAPYPPEEVAAVDKALKDQLRVNGSHALVVGSMYPWVEVMLLALGAAKVTTLDYLPPKHCGDHPRTECVSNEEMSSRMSSGHPPAFDIMVTFSSVEHSGLGRYGDALNPWGDLVAMARAWCVLRQGARALVGVPTGMDRVCFNAHRIYGERMYPHLFANWDQVHRSSGGSLAPPSSSGLQSCQDVWHQIHVLEKVENS